MSDTVLQPAAAPALKAPSLRLPGARLQRQCDCGNHAAGGGECESCKRKKLQRKPSLGPSPAGLAPGLVHEVLASPGRPLDPRARAFLEPRFGQDFSRVRVHADQAAAESARSIHALAYTLGRDVVFGSHQYQPRTKPGLRLLAHELAHAVQQGFRAPDATAEVEVGPAQDAAEREADAVAEQVFDRSVRSTVVGPAPIIRRKVAREFPTIKDDLTYGPIDWAITDSEARQVLRILQGLNETDLADTIAAMDREGITARFFDQLPETDISANQDFLRKVAHLRTWSEQGPANKATTRKGSCDPKQLRTVEAAHLRGTTWLDQAIRKLNALKAAPGDPKQKPALDVFKRHFSSTEPRIIDYVAGVLQGIRADYGKWDLIRLDCFGSWNRLCDAWAAYARGGGHPSVAFCPRFFGTDSSDQALLLIHEFAHIQPGVTDITDRAYWNDRLIKGLSAEEALTNAESYAELVRNLATGEDVAHPPTDEFPDCPKDWKEPLQAAAARAQRANRDAQGEFGKLTPRNVTTRLDAQELGWLGGTDEKTLDKSKQVFAAATKRFGDSITFECEPGGGGHCDTSQFYWHSIGHLHVCPSWLKQAPPERETTLLAGLFGYIGEGGEANRQLRLARLATSLSRRGWAKPTLDQVLTGSAAWSQVQLEVEVEPVQPLVPKRQSYTEGGFLHQRMSDELATYQGPPCGMSPLAFQQKLEFRVDEASTPRPQPFLPPLLKATFQFTAADGVQTWSYEDHRPIYQGPGEALSHQLPAPIDLSIAKNGRLHSRISMDDPTSGVSRLYEDDLTIHAQDPCPKVVTAKDPSPALSAGDKAFVTQLKQFVTDTRAKIQVLLQGPTPKDSAWATSANPNVAAVMSLLGSLQADLESEGVKLRFDQPTGTKANAHYDVLKDVMHLKPPSGVDLAAEVVDLVHEYTHVRQDRAAEAHLMDQKVPTVFNQEVDLQQEIEARREETYFTRLLQLAGVTFGPKADLFNLELTARTFVREFEEERTGSARTRKAATSSIRQEISTPYEQQFKDNGTFGDFPIELTENSHALLYAAWKGGVPPVDLGELPAAVQTQAQLESHLEQALHGSPALPGLFVGPRKQAYDRVLFTVFFRKSRLLQFGIPKP